MASHTRVLDGFDGARNTVQHGVKHCWVQCIWLVLGLIVAGVACQQRSPNAIRQPGNQAIRHTTLSSTVV